MLKKRIRYKLYCDECGFKAVTKTGSTGGRLPENKKVFSDRDAIAACDFHDIRGKLLCDHCYKKHQRKLFARYKAKAKRKNVPDPQFCHLSLQDRWIIKCGLDAGRSFRSIAKELNVSPTTVIREVQRHAEPYADDNLNRVYVDCAKRRECERHVCLVSAGKKCKNYLQEVCPSLCHAPYVCNGCAYKFSCVLKKKIYNPGSADRKSQKLKSESRSKKKLPASSMEALSRRLQPLLSEGKTIYAISREFDDLGVSLSTLYRYHKEGRL